MTYVGRYIDYMTENGKIKIDKDSGMYIKMIQKKIVEKPEKIEPGRHPSGQWLGVYPKEQILAKYNTVFIYKPIIDAIMESSKLDNEFTSKDLTDFIYNHYRNVIKKEISHRSADVYRGKYNIYLLENKLIKEIEPIDGKKRYIKIKKEKSNIIFIEKNKKIEPSKPLTEGSADITAREPLPLDEIIYNHAIKSGWNQNQVPIPLFTIERCFPSFTVDEIKTALSKLIAENKVSQPKPNRIRFKIKKQENNN